MGDTAEPGRVRLVIADDDASMRTLLRTTVGLLPSVSIVGEAEDGVQAVELTVERGADVALLDVNMPRVDGFEAAELIGLARPNTRVLLHTAAMTSEKQFRARSLGVRLVDKMRLEEMLEFAAHAPDAAAAAPPLARLPDQLESVVLLALAEHAGEAVLIVRADGSVPHYNRAAAELLDLPFPAEPTTAEALTALAPRIYREGEPVSFEETPAGRALATRRPASDVLVADWGDRRRPFRVAAVPLVAPSEKFVGVGVYIEALDAPAEDGSGGGR